MLELPWLAVKEGGQRFKEVSTQERTGCVNLENSSDDFVLQEGQSDEEYTGERDSISEISVVALLRRAELMIEMLQNWAR